MAPFSSFYAQRMCHVALVVGRWCHSLFSLVVVVVVLAGARLLGRLNNCVVGLNNLG